MAWSLGGRKTEKREPREEKRKNAAQGATWWTAQVAFQARCTELFTPRAASLWWIGWPPGMGQDPCRCPRPNEARAQAAWRCS